RLSSRRYSFALFVHVLDAGLVDQQVSRANAVHLQAVLVIPFDDAVNLFPVLQHKDHRGLALHLLLVIEIFGMCLLGRRGLLAVGAATIASVATRPLATVAILSGMVVAVQRGTDELAVGKHLRINSSSYGGGIHRIFHGVCS